MLSTVAFFQSPVPPRLAVTWVLFLLSVVALQTSYRQVATNMGVSMRSQSMPQDDFTTLSQALDTAAQVAAAASLDQSRQDQPKVGNLHPIRRTMADAKMADATGADKFLLARSEEKLQGREQTRVLLKNLLGVAAVLNRTLILPHDTCMCTGPLDSCGSWPVLPFGCPLRLPLDTVNGCFSWCAALLERDEHAWPRVLPSHSPNQIPETIRRSQTRVVLPEGLTDLELERALEHYKEVRILELGTAAGSSNSARFCGWESQEANKRFNLAVEPLLRMQNDKTTPIPLSQCKRPQSLATKMPYI
jgi:hypothetical protein